MYSPNSLTIKYATGVAEAGGRGEGIRPPDFDRIECAARQRWHAVLLLAYPDCQALGNPCTNNIYQYFDLWLKNVPTLPVVFMATLEYPINKDPFLLFSHIFPPFFALFYVMNKTI